MAAPKNHWFDVTLLL